MEKLCMDCKHFRTRAIFKVARLFGDNAWCEFGRCAAAPREKTDLVCGQQKVSHDDLRFCEHVRREDGLCKPKGVLWVSKNVV